MAAGGFTIGGKTANELGIELITSNTVLKGAPPTRDYLAEIGGRHGAYDFGADLGVLLHMLDCLVISSENWKSVIRTLNSHLFDNWGHPKTLELIFDEEKTKIYFVRYSGSFDLGQFMRPNYQRFVLPLVSMEPYAFAKSETEVEYQITLSPEDLWYVVTSGLNVPLTIILDNEGGNTIAGFSFKTYNELLLWEAP